MGGKIYAEKPFSLTEAERMELGRLLLKAGYIVSMGREKQGGSYRHYIQFYRQVPFGQKEAAPELEPPKAAKEISLF